ncbi:hypothetical protein [Kordiimonas marina]|uniref:hypothetical protein n=1 Tax=Kordiimonas marina TaxID=2872312 RepID=UPI001FF2874A|nr:hypothetical protein [Kordiimonas marina]MCJ9427468.1 hypothetical protein [Kordiimonas marina]
MSNVVRYAIHTNRILSWIKQPSFLIAGIVLAAVHLILFLFGIALWPWGAFIPVLTALTESISELVNEMSEAEDLAERIALAITGIIIGSFWVSTFIIVSPLLLTVVVFIILDKWLIEISIASLILGIFWAIAHFWGWLAAASIAVIMITLAMIIHKIDTEINAEVKYGETEPSQDKEV